MAGLTPPLSSATGPNAVCTGGLLTSPFRQRYSHNVAKGRLEDERPKWKKYPELKIPLAHHHVVAAPLGSFRRTKVVLAAEQEAGKEEMMPVGDLNKAEVSAVESSRFCFVLFYFLG